MATIITVVGNLTSDPKLRKTKTDKHVANFTVAETTRVRNDEGEFDDGTTSFFRVSAWNALAKNVAKSLKKGQQVIVTGPMEIRDYEDEDGNDRRSVEIRANAVGASLQFGVSQFKKGTAGVSVDSDDASDEEEETHEEEAETKTKPKTKTSKASTRSKASAGAKKPASSEINDLFS